MPKRRKGQVFTSAELSPEVDDMRTWLAAIRYDLSLNKVLGLAIRELAHGAGYDPDWRQNPKDLATYEQWNERRRGRRRIIPVLPEREQGHAEEKNGDKEEERMLVNA